MRAYKVVKLTPEGVFISAFSPAAQEYVVGVPTNRLPQNGALCAFRSVYRAQGFAQAEYNAQKDRAYVDCEGMVVFECEYIPAEQSKSFMYVTHSNGQVEQFGKFFGGDTIFAESITILREVYRCQE